MFSEPSSKAQGTFLYDIRDNSNENISSSSTLDRISAVQLFVNSY